MCEKWDCEFVWVSSFSNPSWKRKRATFFAILKVVSKGKLDISVCSSYKVITCLEIYSCVGYFFALLESWQPLLSLYGKITAWIQWKISTFLFHRRKWCNDHGTFFSLNSGKTHLRILKDFLSNFTSTLLCLILFCVAPPHDYSPGPPRQLGQRSGPEWD